VRPRNQVTYERVGCGNLTAIIEKAQLDAELHSYRVTLVHELRPKGPYWLEPEDLLHFPRLLQLVAQTLIDDGWLCKETRHDFQALLVAIELVESRPQPYFVCETCGAKWFGRVSSMPCPRCFLPAVAGDRLLLPWKRD
jgi:hypothetical protein